MLKSLLAGIVDIIFPRNCILCRQYHPSTAHDPLCPACHEKLPLNKPPFCIRCSRHLKNLSEESLCSSCRTHPPHFDEGWAMLHYEATARTLLQRFKFHNKSSIRKTFATLFHNFSTHYTLQFPNTSMVIPVPLHPGRRRERGYDQAALLAECAAQELRLPLRTNILTRIRHTARQSSLGAKERWTNIGRAFRINPSVNIVGQEIILVDDILTTSATASEAAHTLKDAGASRVIIITLGIASCVS